MGAETSPKPEYKMKQYSEYLKYANKLPDEPLSARAFSFLDAEEREELIEDTKAAVDFQNWWQD